MGKFNTSYELVKMSFKIIKKEKELLVYTILSGIFSIILLLSFTFSLSGIEIFSGIKINPNTKNSDIAFNFLYYFIFYLSVTFVTLFFNTAIITSVNRALKGEKNKFMDGIKSSFNNIGKILIWTLISAIISTILKMIQDRVPRIAKLIVSIIGASWNLATIFAFPLMILDNKKTSDAIKESPKLFIKTWGENAIIKIGIGIYFIFIFILIFFLTGFLAYLFYIYNNLFLSIIMLTIMAIGFILTILVYITIQSVIKIVLYNYTITGVLPDGFDKEKLNYIFVNK